MKKLTEKQKGILKFIEEFSKTNGMSPTVYEIADYFNVKTSTIFAHLKALQKKNYLIRSSKARSISLLKAKNKQISTSQEIITLPVMDENTPEKQAEKRKVLFTKNEKTTDPRSCFAIIMNENCYLSKGILPGDIAILQKNPQTIHPGDLIMAMLDDHSELLECQKISKTEIEFSNFKGNHTITFSKDSIPIKGLLVGIQRSL